MTPTITKRGEATLIIECDTRQQQDDHITEYFDLNNIKHIRNKLYSGDYKLVNSSKIIIDTKKDILEMCNNLTNTANHERIKREIDRAKEIGCERFIFLIANKQIRNIEEVHNWIVPKRSTSGIPYTKVKPETLQKIMKTFAERYNVEFQFCGKLQMGKRIIGILSEVE